MTQTPTTPAPRVLHGDNPFAVDPASDGFATAQTDVPLWSETMFYVGWSHENQVGVWVHCGVDAQDKTLWWTHTLALLPDGVVLADRSYTRLTEGGGNLRVRCDTPLKTWTVTFDGVGEMSSTHKLAAGPLTLGVPVPFQFSITFDGVVPVYDMNDAMGKPGTDWEMGGLHHEQGSRATGTLTALGRTWSLDGPGIRDHSVGARSFVGFGGHSWNYAVWPQSRRALCVMSMWRPPTNQVALSLVMLMDNSTTEITHDFDITGKSAPGGIPQDVELHFCRADGTPIDLTGRVLHNATVTYAEPNHNLIGNHGDPRHGLGDPIIADESIVAWTWPDGDIGIGNYERSQRFSAIPDTQIPLPPGSPFQARHRGRDQ
jgi:hypothetical protein